MGHEPSRDLAASAEDRVPHSGPRCQCFEAIHTVESPFVALHEVDSPDIFASPPYRANAGPSNTGE